MRSTGPTANLSVCTITGSSAQQLETWIQRALDYADELVIMVDASSPAETVQTARSYADVVELFEHPAFPEQVFDNLLRHATGDWILRLDDDELMNRGFAGEVQHLMADREKTHYMLPRRWVVPSADGDGWAWIRQSPWYPDPCFRLIRNVGSLFHHPPTVHSHTEVLGGGRLVDDGLACIYHMDLVWKSRREREDKVTNRYGGAGAYTAEEYYLYEGRVDPRDLVSIPDGEIYLTPGRRGLAEITRRKLRPAAAEPRVISLDEIVRDATARHSEETFAAEFSAGQLPGRLEPDRGYLCEVTVRNVSSGTWRCSGGSAGRTMVSYHWVAEDGSMAVWDGRRSFLPRDIRPGDTADFAAAVLTPAAAGIYTLAWDMVCEGVSWFAEHEVEFPRQQIWVGPG